MQHKNNERKLEKILTDKELEVARANLRAWNYWGRIWCLGRKHHPPDSHTLRLMRIRSLTYRRSYLEMISSLKGSKGKSILDVGCGTSEYLKWLANDYARLIGVDISVEMLKLSREDMEKYNIELIAADALHLPFKDEAFDMSTTFQALHHFPDWKKALTEMVRISKQVSLFEPNGESVLHRIMHSIRRTFRVERRFKQIDEDYELIEFQASGFSSAEIINFLNRKGMNANAFMFGMIPVSLLEKFYKLFPRLLYFMLTAEDLIRKMPIVRNQLGGMLIIGWKTKYRITIHHDKSECKEA